MPTKENRPAGNGAESRTAGRHSEFIRQLRQRRAATYRLPALDCGHVDPLACRNGPDPINGYPEAAEHLLTLGLCPAPNLPALRAMWKRGGTNLRNASRIVEAWEVTA
ncbi:MAG: hypothetical protein ACPGVG_13925 [Mycobacterium sp.]